jgi:hypothetical protein
MKMSREKRNPPTFTYVLAFLIGVILFWSIGRDWLNLESATVFLAGLLGVALVVLLFGVWNISHNSHPKGK